LHHVCASTSADVPLVIVGSTLFGISRKYTSDFRGAMTLEICNKRLTLLITGSFLIILGILLVAIGSIMSGASEIGIDIGHIHIGISGLAQAQTVSISAGSILTMFGAAIVLPAIVIRCDW